GTGRVGEKITADLRPSGATGMKIRPFLLKVVPGREMRWRGHLFVPGLFDGEHVFEIRPLGEEICLFVQHEYYSGLLLPFLETMLKTDTARGFTEMNEALRTRAEQPAGTVP
ncbi:MAG: SRPBCC domain-containing protein, partial [Methanoregula sp.]